MISNAEYCANLVREGDRDRYLATLFAPAQHRDALLSLYAFNVEIARVRDLAREPMPGEIRLQWWREALAGERDSEAAAHPVAGALRATLERYGLSADPLQALLDAHTFDLYDEPMASLRDFDAYADKTRAALFNMAAAILGGLTPETQAVGRHAGIAYAVAGVLASLPLHVARRQLYVPQELLGRHGVTPEAVFAREDSGGLRAALADLRGHARERLKEARRVLAGLPPAVLPALLPVATVGAALRRMEKRTADPMHPDPLPAWRRQWLIWRAARDPRRIFNG